tara:strand:- start:249 stop:440 length:192 start_codon:yes stop_codon:yes gene_type:complete
MYPYDDVSIFESHSKIFVLFELKQAFYTETICCSSNVSKGAGSEGGSVNNLTMSKFVFLVLEF